MARGGRIRSTLRRLTDVALEDFGLRPATSTAIAAAPILEPATPLVAAEPPPPNPPPVEPAPPMAVEVSAPGAADLATLPPGIVWQGAARRSPELQRFCDHLESLRTRV